MSSIQYTIRYIPEPVDKALRQEARKTGKSLNEVVVTALEKATGTTATVQRFNDLDELFGKTIADIEAFHEAMVAQDKLPAETDLVI